MAYCKECGARLDENMRFCPTCGASLGISGDNFAAPVRQPPSQSLPIYRQTHANGAGVYVHPKFNSAMGTGAYLRTILLMCIPLIGFILTVVWACGGTSNLNKRNLARAYLVLMMIVFAIGISAYLLMQAYFPAYLLGRLNFL